MSNTVTLQFLAEAPPAPNDVAVLQKLAAEAPVIVEVGTFCGATAEVMALAQPKGGRLISVDTFKGSSGDVTSRVPEGFALEMAQQRLARFDVRFIVLPSVEAARLIEDQSVDLVFIDAAHDYDSVKADILAWAPKVKPTGIIAGHDYDKSLYTMTLPYIQGLRHLDHIPGVMAHPGVFLAVNELFQEFNFDTAVFGSIWWAKPGDIRVHGVNTDKQPAIQQ